VNHGFTMHRLFQKCIEKTQDFSYLTNFSSNCFICSNIVNTKHPITKCPVTKKQTKKHFKSKLQIYKSGITQKQNIQDKRNKAYCKMSKVAECSGEWNV